MSNAFFILPLFLSINGAQREGLSVCCIPSVSVIPKYVPTYTDGYKSLIYLSVHNCTLHTSSDISNQMYKMNSKLIGGK